MKKKKVLGKQNKVHKELLSVLTEDDIWIENSRPTTSSFSLEESWKEKKRSWGHSLHSMASRSGSFPPALTDYFIKNYSEEGDTVLDPFSGKGTTALQACLSRRKGVGIDIAPEAYALTAAKVIKVRHEEAVDYLESLDVMTLEEAKQHSKKKSWLKEIPKEVRIFYHDDTLMQMIAFREALLRDYSLRHISYIGETAPQFELAKKTKAARAKYAQYWLGVLIGILHGSSDLSLSVSCSHSFSMSPGYVENYSRKHGLKKPRRNLLDCLIKRSAKLQEDGHNNVEGRAILGSAMDLPKTLKNSVDLIVTSPPYFTAQTYAWDNWLREWFLGFDFKEVRTQTLHTSVVDKYSEAMYTHLVEAYQVLKPRSWAFYVVGDIIKKNKNSSTHIVTADIIAEEAERAGFHVELIINDDIPRTSCYNSAFLREDQGLKLDRVVCLYKS